MNIHTPSDSVLAKHSFSVPITAASTNGLVIDTQGYEKAFAVFYANPSGGGTTADCKLQDGLLSNGSDQADVASAVFAQITTAGGAKLETMNINLSKRKRYMRLVFTGAGGAAAGQAYGTIYLFNPRYAPVAQDNNPVNVL